MRHWSTSGGSLKITGSLKRRQHCAFIQPRRWSVARQQILKAFRFTLAPPAAQEEALRRFAGAARWAFNHALAAKMAAHELWRSQVAALVESGVAEETAR